MELDARLLAATGHDFERAALPLLRVFWPSMVRPPSRKDYDQAGVDLIAFDGATVACAVQCKGLFKNEGLDTDQKRGILASIDAFRRSPLSADTYVLLHNQDGRNKVIATEIEIELQTLVAAGKVRKAIQWDRHGFRGALAQQMSDLIATRVREQCDLWLGQLNDATDGGPSFLHMVPVTERTLLLQRWVRPVIEEGATNAIVSIADALFGLSSRWTLLTGMFGAGKTVAALTAAKQFPQNVLYVAAANIEPSQGDGGTHGLMTRILNALSVFADFEDDDAAILRRLGAAVLRSALSRNDATSILVIDGLDENRALASPEAVSRFANSLADLRCPIILTTRTEHFRATFGNFDHLFSELGSKVPTRRIRLLELEPWNDEQVVELVRAAVQTTPSNLHLARLLAAVVGGSDGGWGHELLRHPLFLRMILALTAQGVAPSMSRGETIGNWVRFKLIRDLAVARSTPIQVSDRDHFIRQMEILMERVSAMMVDEGSNTMELKESLNSNEVLSLGAELLHSPNVDLHSLLSVTLLVPSAVRFRDSVPVRFSHRAFQEYFLARHLARTNTDATQYPEAVRRIVSELKNLRSA